MGRYEKRRFYNESELNIFKNVIESSLLSKCYKSAFS